MMQLRAGFTARRAQTNNKVGLSASNAIGALETGYRSARFGELWPPSRVGLGMSRSGRRSPPHGRSILVRQVMPRIPVSIALPCATLSLFSWPLFWASVGPQPRSATTYSPTSTSRRAYILSPSGSIAPGRSSGHISTIPVSTGFCGRPMARLIPPSTARMVSAQLRPTTSTPTG